MSESYCMNAWLCARRAADRDLECVRFRRKRMLGYVLDGQPTVILQVSFPIRREIL